MRTKPMIAFALAAASIGAAPGSHAMDARQTLATFHAALSAGDKAKALEMLAPEVVVYEAGYVERSRDEYASQHLDGDIEFAKTATRKVLKQDAYVDGNTAVIREETETTGTARGTPVHLQGTGTAVLRKQGDRWSIVHLHWSSRKAR